MTHKPISHELTHDTGKDKNDRYLTTRNARNHIVRCTCGWAYSSTHLECRALGLVHVIEYNPRRWDDQKRYDKSLNIGTAAE